MVVQITRDRWLEIGNMPLMTPAWHCVDMSDLHNGHTTRGSDLVTPHQHGETGFPRMIGAARKSFPMVVFGEEDEEGNPHASVAMGLVTNLNRLKQILRPRFNLTAFQVTFEDGQVWEADCSVQWPLQVVARPSMYRLVIDIVIPSGVMRSTTQTTGAWTTSGSKTLDNPGTADQFASVWTMTAAQKITNTSYHDVWLEYTGTVPVTIDTANKTAVYGDGSSALDEINWSKGKSTHWLPLAPGTNTLTLDTEADVTASHYAAYL